MGERMVLESNKKARWKKMGMIVLKCNAELVSSYKPTT